MEFEFFLERQNWGQLWGYSKPHPQDCYALIRSWNGYWELRQVSKLSCFCLRPSNGFDNLTTVKRQWTFFTEDIFFFAASGWASGDVSEKQEYWWAQWFFLTMSYRHSLSNQISQSIFLLSEGPVQASGSNDFMQLISFTYILGTFVEQSVSFEQDKI